jgi:hypothetical protein
MRFGLWILLRYRKIRYGYEFRRIPLTQGKFAIVDADDYEKLNCYSWQCRESGATFYALRLQFGNGRVRIISMHREIMHAPKGMVVDHKNHNGLDNRKENLRIATATENRRHCRKIKTGNSKYKGVYLKKRTGRWEASIGYNHERIHLGYFDSEIEAAKAYDAAAKKYHGEFAALNF